ncbi:MAG TPA: biopolymer transporter ExbD [Deltaproteobacteria bacterium]|nr:biopolymer transporter ExbD [Deltaproteobacteria bacterium]
MGAQLGASGTMSDINMTPLIDIVLVVLIIMMVNIPIQIEEMGLKLPSSKAPIQENRTDVEQLLIAVYDDGKIALNRRAMTKEKMFYELQRRLRSSEKKNVFVDAHVDVEYGTVVDMVDLAREAGAAKVGLAKLKDGGPLPVNSVDEGGMPRGIFFGSPTVATAGGNIDEVKADAALQKIKGRINACYVQRLGARPGLSGKYMVYVAVGPQGELLEPPEIQADTMNDLDLRDCIKAVLPELRYEPLGPQMTAGIRYSILFSPG